MELNVYVFSMVEELQHRGSHTESYDEQHMITIDCEQSVNGNTDGSLFPLPPLPFFTKSKLLVCNPAVRMSVNDLSIVLCVEFLITVSKFFTNTQNDISAKWKYTQLAARRQAARCESLETPRMNYM